MNIEMHFVGYFM